MNSNENNFPVIKVRGSFEIFCDILHKDNPSSFGFKQTPLELALARDEIPKRFDWSSNNNGVTSVGVIPRFCANL
ncbi:MAG: hypothetical protein OPY03_01850 [Nitrosopumilus sp.]|nr:hypothetical protein [Nitrosopumilus sp.]